MTTINMADIQAAADEEYGPLVLEDVPGGTIRLLPLIRLSKPKRDQIVALSDDGRPKATPAKKAAARSGSPAKRAAAKNVSPQQALAIADRFEKILGLAAETEEQGLRLVEHLDGDIAKLKFVFEKWSANQQAGEASPSPS